METILSPIRLLLPNMAAYLCNGMLKNLIFFGINFLFQRNILINGITES